jgi:hypothetical protein
VLRAALVVCLGQKVFVEELAFINASGWHSLQLFPLPRWSCTWGDGAVDGAAWPRRGEVRTSLPVKTTSSSHRERRDFDGANVGNRCCWIDVGVVVDMATAMDDRRCRWISDIDDVWSNIAGVWSTTTMDG